MFNLLLVVAFIVVNFKNFSYLMIPLFFVSSFSKQIRLILDSFFQTIKIFSITFLLLLVCLFIISMHVYYYFDDYLNWQTMDLFRYVKWEPPEGTSVIRGRNRDFDRYNPCKDTFLQCFFYIWTTGEGFTNYCGLYGLAIKCSRGIGDILHNVDYRINKGEFYHQFLFHIWAFIFIRKIFMSIIFGIIIGSFRKKKSAHYNLGTPLHISYSIIENYKHNYCFVCDQQKVKF